ncbi:MAG TPA: hypothetical protein VF121_03215 [Thermoanaerobaculia bacterium]|nr:hypothetical protein [Thermoanaerobaculia bacterium]
MGSQQVTNFSDAKKRRILSGLHDYDPTDREVAQQQAIFAARATIGPLSKTSSFIQALGSPSTESALHLLLAFAEELKGARRPEKLSEILRKYDVDPSRPRPYGALAAGLRTALGAELTATQKETESASAARDALGRTLLDVLTKHTPSGANAPLEDLAQAVRRVPQRELATLFYENAISSLISQSLAAANRDRKEPPEKVEALKEDVRNAFARDLTKILSRVPETGKQQPLQLAEHVQSDDFLSAAEKEIEKWTVGPPIPLRQPPAPSRSAPRSPGKRKGGAR